MSIKSMTRDQLREKALGISRKPLSKVVEYDGAAYEVRQLTLRTRAETQSKYFKVGLKDGETSYDMLAQQVHSVIAATYVPGTDQKVFTEQDFDGLADGLTDGLADFLWQAITSLGDIKEADAKKS